VDRSHVSAAFGLARTRLAADDRPGAIAALADVPPTSSEFVTAQVTAVRMHLSHAGQSGVTPSDVRRAADRLNQLTLDASRREYLKSEILRAALDVVTNGQTIGDERLLDCEPSEQCLRSGLEQSYRVLARIAPHEAQRIELVDRANAVRPRTWL